MKIVLLLIATCLLLGLKKCDSVCDLNTFTVEVKQDLADNGMLDCLRVIDPPHFVEETEEQKNLRLAAQWDTSCAFESNSKWVDKVKKNFGIRNLVDSTGDIVQSDFADQADLCEILRAAIAQNIFNIPDLNMQKIPYDIIDKIDCPGLPDGPKICAATGSSYFQKDSWTIFLDTSAIKIAGKPDFIVDGRQEERTSRSFANDTPENQNNLIKHLMKFNKSQFDLKEGELANLINHMDQKEVSKIDISNLEKNTENANSQQVHVHVKRLIEASFVPNKQFMPVDGASLSFPITESRIVFGFYMASVKSLSDKAVEVFFKLNWDHKEKPETRRSSSSITHSTLTGAFGEVYNPKGGKTLDLTLLYDISGPANVSTESGEENFSFGAITLPEGDVYKKVNTGILEFRKNERWTTLPNFNLTIKNTKKKDVFYFVMYNLVFPLGESKTLNTRLKIGNVPVYESGVSFGPSPVVSSHSGVVLKVKPGSTPIELDYKFDGAGVTIQDFTDARYVQSMTAFELPQSTDVVNFRLDKPHMLDSKGEWNNFDLGATLQLAKKQTVLFIYNINLKIDEAEFSARIRIDSKYNRKSVFTTKGQNFANATGYVVRVMKPGKYNIDIDFKSNAPNTFDPSNFELDGQIVNLQIVLFD